MGFTSGARAYMYDGRSVAPAVAMLVVRKKSRRFMG
jgi:hypothetical protein